MNTKKSATVPDQAIVLTAGIAFGFTVTIAGRVLAAMLPGCQAFIER